VPGNGCLHFSMKSEERWLSLVVSGQ